MPDANRQRTDETRSSAPSSSSRGRNDNGPDWSQFRGVNHSPMPVGDDPRYHQRQREDRHRDQRPRGRSPQRTDQDVARSRTPRDQNRDEELYHTRSGTFRKKNW